MRPGPRSWDDRNVASWKKFPHLFLGRKGITDFAGCPMFADPSASSHLRWNSKTETIALVVKPIRYREGALMPNLENRLDAYRCFACGAYTAVGAVS